MVSNRRISRIGWTLAYLSALVLSLCAHHHGGGAPHSHRPRSAEPTHRHGHHDASPSVVGVETHSHDSGGCPTCHFRAQSCLSPCPAELVHAPTVVGAVAYSSWIDPHTAPPLRLSCRGPPHA